MKLTVIVPVYNIADHLPRFFRSMQAQTYRDFQLLVLDDGSEDDSLAVCRSFAEHDSGIRVIPHTHVGIAQIRNTALSYVETEYTAYADGDDHVEPDYLTHLMTAIEKYDADLAISRVQYHLESGQVEGEFPARGEMLITKSEYKDKLPMLLDDRRLNYLYGKVYRTALLKDIRVENDVKQGSDTMLNFMYLPRTGSIVLTDDLDYHYTRYNKRSVTSYQGKDAYDRILRVNRFIYDSSDEMGMLTEEMLKVIDSRVLQSGRWVIDKIVVSDSDRDSKAEQINDILNNEYYVNAYNRQKDRLAQLDIDAIAPQSGTAYLDNVERLKRLQNKKAAILRRSPKKLVDLYHRLKGGAE